ncbi:hypothetical protein DFQ30_007730, partial [Apophysomyces sp. BC1015]
VSCPQCATPYYLSEARSIPLAVLGFIDNLVHTGVPYLTILGLGCTLLITSTTYGAYTVLTLFGDQVGERLLGNPSHWTWRTWVGLPAIPLALVASRLRWADGILPFAALLILRVTGYSTYPLRVSWPPSPAAVVGLLPWIRILYNNLYALAQRQLSRKLLFRGSSQRRSSVTALVQEQQFAQQLGGENLQHIPEQPGPIRDTELLNSGEDSDLGVTVIGALLWPTISSLVGRCLNHIKFVRHYFPDAFHRNILGGCLFIIAKDIAKLLYKYERIRQSRSRRVKNYYELPKRRL